MSFTKTPAVFLILLAGCTGSPTRTTETADDDLDSGTAPETTSCATTAPPPIPLPIDVTSDMTAQESARVGHSIAFMADGRLVVGSPSAPHPFERRGEYSDDVVYVTGGGDGTLAFGVPAITVDDNEWPDADPPTSTDVNGFGSGVATPGDVTGDGIHDIAIADSPGVDRGDGRWTLVPGPEFACPVRLGEWSTSGRAATCGDVNMDASIDLCTADGVFFGPVEEGALPGISWDADTGRRITTIDADGDGILELVVSDPSTEMVYRLSPSPLGAVALASVSTVAWTATGGEVTALAAGDLVGDAAEDLVVGYSGSSGAVYVGPAPTGGDVAATAVTTLLIPVEALAVGDFDGDGRLDLAVGGASEVSIFLGPLSPGVLGPADAAAHHTGEQYPTDGFGFAMAAADADSDGRTDLAIGAPFENFFTPPPEPRDEGYGENGRVRILSGAGVP